MGRDMTEKAERDQVAQVERRATFSDREEVVDFQPTIRPSAGPAPATVTPPDNWNNAFPPRLIARVVWTVR